MLTSQQISNHLPHKYPMLMVDRITELEAGIRGVGIKNVTINESYFQGHFTSDPVMPGVLIVECMAQTAGLVFGHGQSQGGNHQYIPTSKYLAKIDQMKFVKKVVPGDQLVIEVKLLRIFARLIQVSASARVDNTLVASGRLTFAG